MEPIFVMRPCRGSPACSVLLKKKTRIDFDKVRKKFKEILADTPVVLIVMFKGTEVSIYPSGKLLIRKNDREKVKKMAQEIYNVIL